ncbi:MAG TPA: helix-turn-helix domain-containing protein [Puia sp.]|nr:helix-turn-helix domain-containing protein [Puia sp.]
MRFDTYIPQDILRPYIKHFAITESAGEATYKVLPDTGIVLGFQYRGRLSQVKDGQTTLLNPLGLTGIHDSYRIFKNSADIGTVLVYFREGGAAAFFRQPLHEVFRESISLDNFMLRSELLILEEQLCEAGADAGKIRALEEWLIERIRQITPDPLVMQALALIHQSKGNIRIKELAVQLHTSQSPLEKRFRQVVGATPKKFASIVRLKHTLQQYHPRNSLTDLGYEAGFYDQAHFIKKFSHFTGETPEEFFSGKDGANDKKDE